MRYVKMFSAACTALMAACVVGPNVSSLEPAVGARGTEATVMVGEAPYVGELVAVRDSDFILMLPAGLARIPYGAVRGATFTDTLGLRAIDIGPTQAEQRQLAQFSRYPFGLTDEQVDRLLEALGQDRLVEVSR
jgi:hypothetical protein